jgi:quinol monooxygenase YgiN
VRTGVNLHSCVRSFTESVASIAGRCVLILSLIELEPLPNKREQVLELLQFSVERVRTQAGCLETGIYEDLQKNGVLVYLERWNSEEELHQHIQSKLYLGVLNAMELGVGLPKVSFHSVSETSSMELIESLREVAY